jgi:2-dehydro-3-deoxygluconokinase
LGVPVSLDLNYRRALWTIDDARPIYRNMISLADVVFGGPDEAAIAVDDGTAAELATRLCQLGPAEVVIKLGADGAHALIDGREYQAPAVPVAVVDSVGAGDGFVAGYLAERLAGRGPEERLQTATAVGAFACTVAGDWEGLPRRDELTLLTTQESVTR